MSQRAALRHILRGEGWSSAYAMPSPSGDAEMVTWTHAERGVVHLGFMTKDGTLSVLSWLNSAVDGPSTFLAGDRFAAAVEILMGTRT